MAKNRLTQQQNRRIKQRQQQNLLPSDTSEQGLVISRHGQRLELEDSQGHPVHCLQRKNLGAIVPGDYVRFERDNNDSGVVTALEPRSSLLARPDSRGQLKSIAANIDRIFIVTSVIPALNEGLIDRYLVAAEALEITPVLILNKIDLADPDELEILRKRLSVYTALPYEVIETSATLENGLVQLHAALQGHTSILVGQSGVGKTSLVNALLPDVDARIGDISNSSNKGMHTTSASRLYHLPQGGDMIDSPGVREFGLWEIDTTAVAQTFIEFRPYLGQCKFNNCQHASEPGCAIRQAIDDDNISAGRFASYQRIIASLQER